MISLEEFKKGFAIASVKDETWKKMIKDFDKTGDCKVNRRNYFHELTYSIKLDFIQRVQADDARADG